MCAVAVFIATVMLADGLPLRGERRATFGPPHSSQRFPLPGPGVPFAAHHRSIEPPRLGVRGHQSARAHRVPAAGRTLVYPATPAGAPLPATARMCSWMELANGCGGSTHKNDHQGFRPVGIHCPFAMRRGAGTGEPTQSSRISATRSSRR